MGGYLITDDGTTHPLSSNVVACIKHVLCHEVWWADFADDKAFIFEQLPVLVVNIVVSAQGPTQQFHLFIKNKK